ncbi:hypothetical protein EYF80_010476 [Liparis tanakae]|uniref:Uncharacterized protein n=1 Tax=Liparis tanakae TaxID=230148 RepID=A0A4Z2IPU4_9TELE|nr:hypothetical protein EYF80_010476 [Liparis tanakae]
MVMNWDILDMTNAVWLDKRKGTTAEEYRLQSEVAVVDVPLQDVIVLALLRLEDVSPVSLPQNRHSWIL